MSGDELQNDWQAVLAHELRSPVAAILGYQELLEDGTFGELDTPALDAVRRIGYAAEQLISLIEGLEHAPPDDAPAAVSAADLIDDAITAVRFDADARGTRIEPEAADVAFHTLRTSAVRAIVLALGAAVKVSPDATLTISAEDGVEPAILIRGSRLRPDRDSGAPGTPLSGAGLRLQLARAAARPADGRVELPADGVARITLPRLSSGPRNSD